MWKLYVLLTIAILSALAGITGFFWISWAEVPEDMLRLGVMSYWLIPVTPSLVLGFVGVHLVARYTKVPIVERLKLALVQSLLLVGVLVSLYAIATSDLPVRHTAFNWTFYLLPIMYLAYKVELMLWLKHG